MRKDVVIYALLVLVICKITALMKKRNKEHGAGKKKFSSFLPPNCLDGASTFVIILCLVV